MFTWSETQIKYYHTLPYCSVILYLTVAKYRCRWQFMNSPTIPVKPVLALVSVINSPSHASFHSPIKYDISASCD